MGFVNVLCRARFFSCGDKHLSVPRAAVEHLVWLPFRPAVQLLTCVLELLLKLNPDRTSDGAVCAGAYEFMLKLLRKASQSLSCESEDSLKSSNTKALRPAILLSRSDPKRATDKQEYDGKDAAMPLGIVHANGSAAQDTRKEPLVHFTLVLDVSATMRGDPLKAVARGIRQLLKHLQPWDSLTICT